MLIFNLNADSNENGDLLELLEKIPEASSGTSNSSIVNADGSSNIGGGDDSCSTRAGNGSGVFTFDFGIMKVEGRNDVVTPTKELFPMSSGNWKMQQQSTLPFPAKKSGVDLSWEQGENSEMVKMVQAQKPVKKSRRGPRSRSSQYRGVTFYRRTGRWESHIWDCGKQVYLGGFDTAHAAARAYDRAAIKFRGVDADINFNLIDYDDDLKPLKNLSKEEFVQTLRRQSTGFSRGSSKYRGVTLQNCGRSEAPMGQFLGKKAYEKAATNCNGREAVTNFEPSKYESNMKPKAINEGDSHNLDLNLGIATPGHGPKENKENLQFQPVPYNMHLGRNSRVETNVHSVIDGPALKSLVVTEDRPSVWNATYSSFFPTQEIGERIVPHPYQGLPNWAWQTQGQVTATQMPQFSTAAAASSGFSISATSPPKSMNPFPQSLCFTSPSTPVSIAPQYYYQVKSPQAPQ
ncbi:hypothetical protein TanjilG_11298 [Lupinus angustifolius]|uniref:AP2/ERF domain-containing protein n=1 Tax=Lupinus angustifolius TaxID=3871 RepID=A0A1J7H8J3_LUPAN|nr:PREDICTED: ethylene-responsive transcription factor RAP2-7-like [Lupinus angustifolius]OIW09160.1 hypothetical protein TanjilG_11298 [Lupinus angustifolius]